MMKNILLTHSPCVVGRPPGGRGGRALEERCGVVVLGVDGDDGVAVDVEEGRRIPERG